MLAPVVALKAKYLIPPPLMDSSYSDRHSVGGGNWPFRIELPSNKHFSLGYGWRTNAPKLTVIGSDYVRHVEWKALPLEAKIGCV